jgi:DNA-binding CsgD family transcriptional regulator
MLAHHFQEAGDKERVVRYASAAATHAAAVYSHEEAAQYLALALTALPASAVPRRLEISEALGDAWLHARRHGRALEAFTWMLECAKTLNVRREMATAYRKIGVVQNEQAVGTGLTAWESGLALLGGVDARSEEAMIRAEISLAAFLMGQYERGAAVARAGVAAAASAGEPSVLSRCYKALGLNLRMQGHNAEAREWMDKAVTLARQANDVEAELYALNNAACYAMEDNADFGSARESLERACALVDKVGGIGCSFSPVLSLAELSLLEGKWDDAESLSTKVLAQLEELGRAFPFGFAARDLACVHLLRGRVGEAEALLQEARRSAEAASDSYTLIYVLMGLAQVELRRKRASSAKAWLEQALALCAQSGYAGVAKAEALLMLTEVQVLLGDAAEARAGLEKAVEAAEPFRYLVSRVFRARGQVVAQEGSLDDAVAFHRAGLEAAASQPYEEALLRYHLGVCLLRRNRSGDHRVARGHLSDALTGLQRLGARPDVEVAQQAFRRIRGRVPAGHILTKREQEVLAMLAEGLSNAAIAGRLYLSERTVEVHVSHILDKLRLESRTQLAAWVAKHGVNPRLQESVP